MVKKSGAPKAHESERDPFEGLEDIWDPPVSQPDPMDAHVTDEEADRAIAQVESGDILSSPITENEVNRVLRQEQIANIRKAFSGSYFNVCPISHDYKETAPADRLVSELHCKHFKNMSEDTKILLYRACLQLCDLSSNDFPYPFAEPTPEPENEAESVKPVPNLMPLLCPFAGTGRIDELTRDWSRADRDCLRRQVRKHVVMAVGAALIVGIVLGALLAPSGSRTVINLPRENGPAMQRDNGPSPYISVPNTKNGITPAIQQPSRTGLIVPSARAPDVVSVPHERGN